MYESALEGKTVILDIAFDVCTVPRNKNVPYFKDSKSYLFAKGTMGEQELPGSYSHLYFPNKS